MKITSILLFAAASLGIFTYLWARKPVKRVNTAISSAPSPILDQCILKLNSKDSLCLKDFKGKKMLLVNVASECGFTYQYKDLEKLYTQYKDRLVVIGFPCNQFGGQEPGTETEIVEFCSSKYNVTFPLTTKIDVKGDQQHPIYRWLTNKTENGVGDYKVSWNFNKFLLDENGQLIGFYGSRVNPMDSSITNLLQ